MSPLQVVAVALRIFAVWAAVQSAFLAYAIYKVLSAGHSAFALPGTIATAVVTLVAAVMIWAFPRSIAKLLLGPVPDESPKPSSTAQWFGMGCALIGVWLLAVGIPAIVRDVILIADLEQGEDPGFIVKQFLVPEFVQVAMALWLLLGASGMRRVFPWAQTAGIKRAL